MATEPEGPRINPLYIVLGGVLAAAVALLVIVNVFLLDDDEPTFDDPPVVAQSTPAPQVNATPTPTPTPAPEDMEVFEIFEGRDPFRPLVFPEPVDGAPDGPSPPGGATPAPDEPAPPGEAPPGEAPPGATPPPGEAPPGEPQPEPTPAPRSGAQVEVMFVAEDDSHATVRVGEQVHEDARPGDTLSNDVVVERIERGCVFFERRGEHFRLCEGEQVRK